MEIGHHENAGLDANLTRPGPTAGLLAEVTELSMEAAPRRFSLCAIDVEADDGAVLAWGFAFPEGTILCAPDGSPTGMFRSAKSTMRMFHRCGELRLVWIDPPTSD